MKIYRLNNPVKFHNQPDVTCIYRSKLQNLPPKWINRSFLVYLWRMDCDNTRQQMLIEVQALTQYCCWSCCDWSAWFTY